MNPIIKTFNFPEEILSKYDIIQEMGRGAFSTVYKIKSKLDNTIYCLKKINIKKTPDRKNEINILKKLNHQNLVKYISSYEDEEGIYIIMEFCIYGDLYSLLHMVKKKKVYVNEDIIWDISYQCLLGLEYLHSQQIIHRDIKLLNIFMSKNKIVKIGDMGQLGKSIVNDNPPELPDCYSNELKFFVNKLMTKNKKLRPSATEAMQFIPQKIKNKFENNKDKIVIDNNKEIKDDINNKKENKRNNSKEQSNDINKGNKNILNNQKLINIEKVPIKDNNNQLISGQTFYKFFRKNTDRTQRKLTASKINSKKGGTSTSLFDSKNMNSILIMSKTMNGTREGFYRNRNTIATPTSPIKEENKIKIELKKIEEQKVIDTNNKTNKPLIIEPIIKKENNIKNLNNTNINIDENKTREDDVWKRCFNFSYRNNKDKEINFMKNFFNRKKSNKSKSGITHFNPTAVGLYKSYHRENQKNKVFDMDNPIKFPLIQESKASKILKHFNNNKFINNKIEQAFRKTANSFNFNNKLTIHDLK